MPARLQAFLGTLLSLLIFWGVCTLRALPAFERGTYCTEGGEWLAHMWQTGFWHMIFGARGDYGVLGNMVVIKGADLLAQLWGGHSLAACGPFFQHSLSCLYVALIFAFIFAVLRAHHGWWRALLVSLVMLLVPDIDNDNRIFGEANNIGFFNALGIIFLYYDLWLRPKVSLSRGIAYGLLIVFHLLTSPLAALIAAGFSVLLSARALWDWRKQGMPLPRLLWLHAGTLLLAGWSVLQAKPESADPMAETAAHTAAAALPQFWKNFVELVLCRQLLYPLTLTVYEHFTNGRTIALLVLVLALLVAWLLAERRRAKGNTDWWKLSLPPLLLAIAFCMSAITLWSRGWLAQSVPPYTSVWPARYYLVQSMLAAGVMALVLLRAGDLWPHCRRDIVALLLVLMASFVVPQVAAVRAYLSHYDPSVRAKEWQHQLARVYDLQTMTHGGKLPVQPDLSYAVEMYIGNHFVPVPSAMLAEFFAQKRNQSRDDACPIAMTEVSAMKVEAKRRSWPLRTHSLRVIPCDKGTLVTVDLELSDAPHFDVQRRKLWLGQVPGLVKLQAASYAVNVPRVSESAKKKLNDIERLLFKVQLWFDGQLTLSEMEQRLAGLPVVLGAKPDQYLARGELMAATGETSLSTLVDEASVSKVLQTTDQEAWRWKWQPHDLKLKNVSASERGIKILPEAPFDEQAYVRLNADVEGALKTQAIASGKAHFDHWGKDEPRQSCVYSVTLDVAKAGLTVDALSGLYIDVSRPSDRPERLRCVLHGPQGEQTAFGLIASDGGLPFETYHLPLGFLGATHAVQKLEIQFEQPTRSHNFTIEDIRLYRRPQ